MTKTKKQHSNNKYTVINAIVGILFLATIGGLIYCATNMKTEEEKRIVDMKDSFAEIAVGFHCSVININIGTDGYCDIDHTGFTEDGDFYVEFEHRFYEDDNNQIVEPGRYRMRFYRDEYVDDDARSHYLTRVEKYEQD